MGLRYEAVYLRVLDELLDSADQGKQPDDAPAIITDVLAGMLPPEELPELDMHILYAGQFLEAAMAAITGNCAKRQMQPLLLVSPSPEGERQRPAVAFTGVVAAVISVHGQDALGPVLHWSLSAGKQKLFEDLLRATLGTSLDQVRVCPFPFSPSDLLRLKPTEPLLDRLLDGLRGDDAEDADRALQQCVLRRTPPQLVWQFPDHALAFPVVFPVAVVSLMPDHYDAHGAPHEGSVADMLSRIIADGLAEREMVGCEVEVYCGHLHRGEFELEIGAEMIADLRAQSGRPQKVALGDIMLRAGRNDPCPCGSGKKYKKCCAA